MVDSRELSIGVLSSLVCLEIDGFHWFRWGLISFTKEPHLFLQEATYGAEEPITLPPRELLPMRTARARLCVKRAACGGRNVRIAGGRGRPRVYAPCGQLAVGQIQWYPFGVGAPPILELILVGIWGGGGLTDTQIERDVYADVRAHMHTHTKYA